jgi:hypothetical protein
MVVWQESAGDRCPYADQWLSYRKLGRPPARGREENGSCSAYPLTRWVDGQWAWERPELSLTNWERGRLLGGSGFLSGDDIVTVRDVFLDKTGRAPQRR